MEALVARGDEAVIDGVIPGRAERRELCCAIAHLRIH